MLTAWLHSAWAVLVLFLVPWGGGIPAGVLLAKNSGLGWPSMTFLYFISDVILAFIFEPIMWLVIAGAKRSTFFMRLKLAFKMAVEKMTAHHGTSLGPLALIIIAFGADPMTGRSVAAASGHGFFSGWALAITGDMFYFAVIMASTLWLNNVLGGDSTRTMVIVLVGMMLVPALVRRLRHLKSKKIS